MVIKANETQQQRRQRVEKLIARFDKAYPNATTALNFSNPLELLVATILSAQSTDVRINQVTASLFQKYKTAADYASADVATLEQEILASGFYHQKAKALIGVGRMLQENFGGRVPDTMEDLVSLPGVARKTANVVLGNAFGKSEGIVVDRHVSRVSARLLLTEAVDPIKIEQDLMIIVPNKYWIVFPHMLILHGRAICVARKPKCAACVVNDLCPSAFSF